MVHLRQVTEDKPDEVEMFHMTVDETLPVTERELRRETHRDALLSRVVRLVESGWEGVESQPNFAPYLNRKYELIMHHGILMWGNRVIVPTKLRGRVMETLHDGQEGMSGGPEWMKTSKT